LNEAGIISAAGVDRRVIPESAREDRWTAPDGYAIRRIDFAQPAGDPRGSILFLPGRGDAYEKYLETLNHWSACGWRVTSIDWRGQAGSGRLGFDPVTGHVGDFAIWVDDLAAFWTHWAASAPGPKVLVAHSMGGHLALRALAEHRIKPDALVLSAPMLGLPNKGIPSAVLHAVARMMTSLGDPRRPAWKWSEKPGAVPVGRIGLLTHDEARYADELWWRENRPELVMGPGSWGWVERALASIRQLERPGVLEGVATPVFILGTTADRLVDYGAIQRAANRLPQAELRSFGLEASHEILREVDAVRDTALAAIDEFLDRTAPKAD
jgi:lysophospholipase